MKAWQDIALTAERTHGIVTYDRLRAAGLSDHQVRAGIAGGRLVPMGYGVFRLGGAPPSFEGEVLAAIVEFPGDTWASHHTAARLHDLRVRSAETRIELTRPTTLSATRSAARIHRSTRVLPHHRTTIRGVPCLTASRTLFDLARTTGERRLVRSVDRGLNLRICTMGSLLQVLYELGGRGRPGTRRMRVVLDHLGQGYVPPESELEAVGMTLFDGLGFEWQVEISDEEGYIRRVDGINRPARLVVEFDGAQHRREPQLSLDRQGDRRLERLGLEVVRIRWDDIASHGEVTRAAIVARIAAAAA